MELFQKHFDVAVILVAYQKKASLSERQKIAERKKEFTHRKDTKEVHLLFASRSEKALYTYLARQNVGVSDYMDYIKACQFLGLDLTKKSIFCRTISGIGTISASTNITAKKPRSTKESERRFTKNSPPLRRNT